MGRKPRQPRDPAVRSPTGQILPGHTLEGGGRPRGSKNRSDIISKVLMEEVPVAMRGRKTKIPAAEAAFRRLTVDALNGDKKSIVIVLREWAALEERALKEQAPTYPFSDADKQVIAEIHARMKACQTGDKA